MVAQEPRGEHSKPLCATVESRPFSGFCHAADLEASATRALPVVIGRLFIREAEVGMTARHRHPPLTLRGQIIHTGAHISHTGDTNNSYGRHKS